MKNKSTLMFYSFLLTCCFTLLINAQEQKSKNDFTFKLIEYSSKSNLEKEHTHVLELKNNSNSPAQYKISVLSNLCVDNHHNKMGDKKESNIKAEIFSKKNSINNKVDDIVTLQPNESRQFNLKTHQKANAKLDTWNCTTLRATKLIGNKSKSINHQTVKVKTFVSNPSNQGH